MGQREQQELDTKLILVCHGWRETGRPASQCAHHGAHLDELGGHLGRSGCQAAPRSRHTIQPRLQRIQVDKTISIKARL